MATLTTTIQASTSSVGDQTPHSKSYSTNPSKWKVHETPQDAAGIIPTIAVTLFLGWNGILVVVVIYFFLFARQLERVFIIGLSTLSLVLPHHYPPYLGYRIGNWMLHQAEKYFGMCRRADLLF